MPSVWGACASATTARPSAPAYSAVTPCVRNVRYAFAMSGFVNLDPTAGAAPSRRNTRAVSGNVLNRGAFAAVWSAKVWSTTKPLAASRSAGLSAVLSDSVPWSRNALAHSAGVPGTPTDSPEFTTVSKSMAEPSGFRKVFSVNVEGAVSRPSMVETLLLRAS